MSSDERRAARTASFRRWWTSWPSDQRKPLTWCWHTGRDDSAGDNETCSRPPTDLRGSPCFMRQPPPGGSGTAEAMTAGATGGLECSPRRGCVANTAYLQTNQEAAPLGPFCLATSQTSPARRPSFHRSKWNSEPPLASGHPGQRRGEVKGWRTLAAF